MRGYTLSLREREFVEASRSLGASNMRIIFREVLPNLIGPLLVYTTLLIPQAIIFEAALSYLGLGVPQETASWGGLLNQASQLLRRGLVADALPGPVPRHRRLWPSTCSATASATRSTCGRIAESSEAN